jgi:predicted unusual protein kinase regulating ubiquinone biosynthesis (AarF/ABC1/UbiB family)
LVIFTPPILLFPLLFFKRTEDYWRELFVKAVERAGVVFIKAFQYLSHRRDIIGPEMAHKFEHLRENAPTHSFETTKKYFRDAYGKDIDEIF